MKNGFEDCRPSSSKPKPGATDRTAPSKRVGYGNSQNVSPFADRATTNKAWKGMKDSRPDCK